MLLLFYILPVICYKFKMLVFVWCLAMLVARGLLALRPGIEPCAPNNGGTVLTTELPGKSLLLLALNSQLYPTVCDLMDCSLPGSSVHGILQARVLEWVAIPFFKGSSRSRDWTWVSLTAGRFFTIWASRGAQNSQQSSKIFSIHRQTDKDESILLWKGLWHLPMYLSFLILFTSPCRCEFSSGFLSVHSEKQM